MLHCGLIIISPLEVTNSGYPTAFQNRLWDKVKAETWTSKTWKKRGKKHEKESKWCVCASAGAWVISAVGEKALRNGGCWICSETARKTRLFHSSSQLGLWNGERGPTRDLILLESGVLLFCFSLLWVCGSVIKATRRWSGCSAESQQFLQKDSGQDCPQPPPPQVHMSYTFGSLQKIFLEIITFQSLQSADYILIYLVCSECVSLLNLRPPPPEVLKVMKARWILLIQTRLFIWERQGAPGLSAKSLDEDKNTRRSPHLGCDWMFPLSQPPPSSLAKLQLNVKAGILCPALACNCDFPRTQNPGHGET